MNKSLHSAREKFEVQPTWESAAAYLVELEETMKRDAEFVVRLADAIEEGRATTVLWPTVRARFLSTLEALI